MLGGYWAATGGHSHRRRGLAAQLVYSIQDKQEPLKYKHYLGINGATIVHAFVLLKMRMKEVNLEEGEW